MTTPSTTTTPSPLLTLPAELRNTIYEHLLAHDIDAFADDPSTFSIPPLLTVCHQLCDEYSSIFFTSRHIKIDAYYNDTDSWCEVRDSTARQVILRQSTFSDLADFWSLASARRYCQRVCHSRQNAQRGIVTVMTNAGFKRWQWNVWT